MKNNGNDSGHSDAAREIGRLEAQFAQPKAPETPQKRTTQAPPPINPIRGGTGALWRPAAKPIDWSHWRLMPVLPLWHAVVLSLNQNPEGFRPDSADDSARKRMDVCLAHLSSGLLKLRNGNDATLPVDVSAFRAWADSLGLDLPEQFPAAVSVVGAAAKAGQVSHTVPSSVLARAGTTLPASQLDERAGKPKYSMTRAGLVKAQQHRWPTIETDLKSANENGLAAAKADVRGWHEEEALEWARSRGKLSDGSGDTLSAAMRNLPATKHKLQD